MMESYLQTAWGNSYDNGRFTQSTQRMIAKIAKLNIGYEKRKAEIYSHKEVQKGFRVEKVSLKVNKRFWL